MLASRLWTGLWCGVPLSHVLLIFVEKLYIGSPVKQNPSSTWEHIRNNHVCPSKKGHSSVIKKIPGPFEEWQKLLDKTMDSHRKPGIWKPLHIVNENALSVSLARKISIRFWVSSKKSSQVTWEDTSHKQKQNLRKSKKKQRHCCVTFSFCIFWAWAPLQKASYNLFVSIQTWRGHQTWRSHYWRTTCLKTFEFYNVI